MEQEYHNDSAIDLAEANTILGPHSKMTEAGRIRPGTKTIKKNTSDKDKKIFHDMVAKGADWDEVAKALGADKVAPLKELVKKNANDTAIIDFLKANGLFSFKVDQVRKGDSWELIAKAMGDKLLIPVNVDYFTVKPCDFVDPENAKKLMKYADQDGRLRQFPIFFPFNSYMDNIPHRLMCFGADRKSKFVSEYRNNIRMCKVCDYSFTGKKTFRFANAQKKATFRGECVPENCNEFQAGACKFVGKIQFLIPGLKGSGVYTVITTSMNSMLQIKSTLELVNGLTKRVAGLINDKPFFIIRKVKDEILRPDLKSGKAVLGEQFLINLDTSLDMLEIARYGNRLLEMGRVKSLLSGGNGMSLSAVDNGGNGVVFSQPAPDVIDVTAVKNTPLEVSRANVTSEPAKEVEVVDNTEQANPSQPTEKAPAQAQKTDQQAPKQEQPAEAKDNPVETKAETSTGSPAGQPTDKAIVSGNTDDALVEEQKNFAGFRQEYHLLASWVFAYSLYKKGKQIKDLNAEELKDLRLEIEYRLKSNKPELMAEFATLAQKAEAEGKMPKKDQKKGASSNQKPPYQKPGADANAAAKSSAGAEVYGGMF